MSEKENDSSYPLRSLHDFLAELDNEWDKFRRASIVGIMTSSILLIFLFLRILGFLALLKRPRVGLFDILNEVFFQVLIAAFVIYEISLLLGQHRFFKKWERRVGLLLHLEEKIMKKILD